MGSVSYQVSATFTPDGMSTTFGTNVYLCPHAHNPTFGFGLPPQVRLDNDNDAALGHSENDILSGYGPSIEAGGGCPYSFDDIYVTVSIPDGGNNQAIQFKCCGGALWPLPQGALGSALKN